MLTRYLLASLLLTGVAYAQTAPDWIPEDDFQLQSQCLRMAEIAHGCPLRAWFSDFKSKASSVDFAGALSFKSFATTLPGIDGIQTNKAWCSKNQRFNISKPTKQVAGQTIHKKTTDTEKTNIIWISACYLIVGGIPAAMWMFLNRIKSGWIVDDATRRKQNNRFTWNVTAISIFNIFETATQAAIQLYIGIAVVQNIKLEMYPKTGFNAATIWHTAWQSFAMLLIADFFNYFFHRLCHENKWLYRNLHSIHHQYQQVEHPVWSLFYVHPIEMALSNVAFFMGIHILQTTMFNCLVFGAFSSIYVGAGHSGLLLPQWADKFLDTSFHQLHHSKLRCNYSEHFTIIDRLFGTYVAMPEEHKEMRREQQKLATK